MTEPPVVGAARMTHEQQGFSLLELMIVVALILILVSISVPNLSRSRMLAREASVIVALDTLNNELEAHWMTCGGYPSSLADLESAAGGCGTPANEIDRVSSLAPGHPCLSRYNRLRRVSGRP